MDRNFWQSCSLGGKELGSLLSEQSYFLFPSLAFSEKP